MDLSGFVKSHVGLCRSLAWELDFLNNFNVAGRHSWLWLWTWAVAVDNNHRGQWSLQKVVAIEHENERVDEARQSGEGPGRMNNKRDELATARTSRPVRSTAELLHTPIFPYIRRAWKHWGWQCNDSAEVKSPPELHSRQKSIDFEWHRAAVISMHPLTAKISSEEHCNVSSTQH